jgi:hypothetical protein
MLKRFSFSFFSVVKTTRQLMFKIEIPIDMKRNIIVFTGTLVFFVYSGITVASVMLELNIAVMICTLN